MAKALMISGHSGSVQSSGLTRYFPCANCGVSPQTTEAWGQIVYRNTGTGSNLYIRITANTLGAASTFALRKNGVNGSQSITIPAATTGDMESASTDAITPAGIKLNYRLTTGTSAGNSLTFSIMGMVFAATTNTVVRHTNVGLRNLTELGQTFYPLSGDAVGTFITEARARFDFNAPCTLKNLLVYVASNTAPGPGHSLNVHVNGVSVIMKDLDTATGVLEDTVDTQAIVSGDDVNFMFDQGHVLDPEIDVVWVTIMSIESISTDKTFHSLNARPVSQVFGAVTYWPIGGGALTTALESRTKADVNMSADVSNLTGYISNNTITA